MDFALIVAGRYLRARRKAFVSIIGVIAVVGIALGVWALSAVLAITSGFQEAFRDKVLGVNAHVLVLKFGWDFTEYREVMGTARATPGVTGAAPFLINPMMITRGERIAGVLVKGVDPALAGQVLDLPSYIVQGSLAGLRAPNSQPPPPPHDDPSARGDANLDVWIDRVRLELAAGRAVGRLPAPGLDPDPAPRARLPHDDLDEPATPPPPEAPPPPRRRPATTSSPAGRYTHLRPAARRPDGGRPARRLRPRRRPRRERAWGRRDGPTARRRGGQDPRAHAQPPPR